MNKKDFVIKKSKRYRVIIHNNKYLIERFLFNARIKKDVYRQMAMNNYFLHQLIWTDDLEEKYPKPKKVKYDEKWKKNRWNLVNLKDKIERIRLAFEDNNWEEWKIYKPKIFIN